MALQTCNLFWLTSKYPNMFSSRLAKLALAVNAWSLSVGVSSFWEALGAREAFGKALTEAGITPRAGTSSRVASMLSLIPLFYVSRRSKKLQIERNIPYASIKDIDPALLDQWKQVHPIVRNVVMIVRGRISQWMSLDVIRRSDVELNNAPVLFAIHGGGYVFFVLV